MARIKAHPDKNVSPGMSPEEVQNINDKAALIGQAADVLLDPKKVSDGNSACDVETNANELNSERGTTSTLQGVEPEADGRRSMCLRMDSCC